MWAWFQLYGLTSEIFFPDDLFWSETRCEGVFGAMTMQKASETAYRDESAYLYPLWGFFRQIG